MASRLKIWNGSAWVARPVKVWTGSAWVTKQIKFWNGSEWVGDTGGAAPVEPVFRSNWLSTYAARPGTITVNKPAGTVENDIILVGIVHAKGMPAQNDLISLDAGFTRIGVSTWVRDNSNFDAKFEMWWKRAGASEPASYGFDVWGTSNNQAYAVAYSGCPTSGNPIDVFSQNYHTNRPVDDLKGNAGRGLSVTTTQANDKLIWLGHNWDATGLAPPSQDGGSEFMIERADHLIYSSDHAIAAAGPTGDYTQTQASTNPWTANLIALKGA